MATATVQRWRQRQRSGGSSNTLATAGLVAAGAVWCHRRISGGSRVAGATLPPRAAKVVTKTPAATAMVGAQTTINNPLKAAEAMAMETATTRTLNT